MLVDRDAFLEEQRGWQIEAIGEWPPFPRGWLPRVAIGVDASGRAHKATIARTDADLWTGTASTWSAEISGGTFVQVDLVRTLGERSVLPVAVPEIP